MTSNLARFTGRARAVLAAASDAARALGHTYVGTEHFLLGLYGAPDGLAAQLLQRLGLDHATARARVLDLLAGLKETG